MKVNLNDVVITKIDINDETSILEIANWFDSWYEWPKPKWTKNKIIKRIKDYAVSKFGAKMYVAKYNNNVVGTVALLKYDDTKKSSKLSPWIANAYIKQDYRKNGIYKKLLNELYEEAKSNNIEKLYLWTDWENLYEDMGFNYCGKIKIDDGSTQRLYCYELK